MEFNNLIDWNSLTPLQQIGRSIQANNEWSAQQASNQMEFQREMSNTAHQREIADLKAAGLNPVLSAKLGGASTPAGAMGGTDTSGTAALVELLSKALETANSAATAASNVSHSGSGRSSSSDNASSLPEDNSASQLDQNLTTGDFLGISRNEDGEIEWPALKNLGYRIDSFLKNVPGSSKFRGYVRNAFNALPKVVGALDAAYTFDENSAKALDENRKRLQADDASNRSNPYGIKGSGKSQSR